MSSAVDKKTLEYSTFTDVLTEVRDTLLIDLMRYTAILPAEYAAALRPEPTGVYVQGRLEPLLNFDEQQYWSATAFKAKASADIGSFERFIQAQEPVVDHRGKILSPYPARHARLYRDRCMFRYSALHLLFIAAWDFFQTLHPATYPTTTAPSFYLKTDHYVREDWLLHPSSDPHDTRPIFDEANNPGIGKMLQELESFVNRDREMLYHLRFQNTQLMVEKGHDYRVIEYYRQLFDERDDESFLQCYA